MKDLIPDFVLEVK